MADLKAPSLGKPVYNGTHGNLSLGWNNITLKATPAGTDIIMLDIPIGTRITGCRLTTEALGGSVVLQPFVRFNDDTETQLSASMAASSAKSEQHVFKPIMIADKGPAVFVVKVTGAAATGEVSAALEFIAEGY